MYESFVESFFRFSCVVLELVSMLKRATLCGFLPTSAPLWAITRKVYWSCGYW